MSGGTVIGSFIITRSVLSTRAISTNYQRSFACKDHNKPDEALARKKRHNWRFLMFGFTNSSTHTQRRLIFSCCNDDPISFTTFPLQYLVRFALGEIMLNGVWVWCVPSMQCISRFCLLRIFLWCRFALRHFSTPIWDMDAFSIFYYYRTCSCISLLVLKMSCKQPT